MKKNGSILLESMIAILILLMVMLSLLAIYDTVYKTQLENVYRTKGGEVAQTIANLVKQKGYTYLNTKINDFGEDVPISSGSATMVHIYKKVYSISNTWEIENGFNQDFDFGNDPIRIKNLGISPSKLSVTVVLAKTTPTLSNGTEIYSNNEQNQNFISGKVSVNWNLGSSSSKSAVVDFIIPEIRETTQLDTTT